MAPDGKIYIAKENRDYLSAIHNPDQIGTACEYEEYAVDLGGNTSLMGLPNFMPFLFYQPSFSVENTCLGDTTYFHFGQYHNSDSLTWDFGDGSPTVTSENEIHPFHIYDDVGNYAAKLIIHHCNAVDIVEQSVPIYSPPDR